LPGFDAVGCRRGTPPPPCRPGGNGVPMLVN